MIVFVDPLVVSGDGDKTVLSKCLGEAGFTYDFIPQRIERTVSWYADGNGITADVQFDIESECLVVLSAEDAVKMVKSYHEHKQGVLSEGVTLTEWVQSLQIAMPEKNLTIFIMGLNKYYSNLKLSKRRAYQEKVTGKRPKGKNKAGHVDITITCEEADEVFVEVQLLTGCILQHTESYIELAEEIKRFTKAVMDKPKKKHRLDSGFSFTDTNGPGIAVSKGGEGLMKVWKQQIMQFNNFGPDMAEAVVTNYTSPLSLKEACSSYSQSDAERAIGDINVRRGTSIVATNRRIGKEHARRIHTLVTSTDPDQVIK